ncbi:MAG: hypothetical protein U0935_16525 [Pirellulales bacterium]
MPPLHQIYVTNCTCGTSAIERKVGEGAERKLGISARASSLPQEELRQHYANISRLVSYGLPNDVPAEERGKYTLDTAPRRLFYHPNLSGWQVGGQIVLRPVGNTLSHFAHLLCAPQQAPPAPLSPLSVLQLWGAPGWRLDEPPDVDFDLPALSDVTELHRAPRASAGTFRPLIRDDLFRALLTAAPAASSAAGSDGLLPARWRTMPQPQRLALFRQALAGYFEMAVRPHGSALLVIEPSVAVCFFYGIARLLPPGPLRDAVSFSTFEPYSDRLGTALAATCYHDRENGDVKPERYQRGFVLHTFQEGKVSPLGAPHPYIDFILDALLSGGWAAVDRVQAAAGAAQVATLADLAGVVEGCRIARQWLVPTQPPPSLASASPITVAAFRQALASSLAGAPQEAELQALLAAPEQRALAVLEHVAEAPPDKGRDPSVNWLLQHLSEEQLGPLIDSRLPPLQKFRALATFVAAQHRLPAGCESLFESACGTPQTPRDQQLQPLALPLLKALTPASVQQLVDKIDPVQHTALLICLASTDDPTGEKLASWQRLASRASNDAVARALELLGERLDRLPPEVRRELRQRFISTLDNLHLAPTELIARITCLRRVERLLAADPANAAAAPAPGTPLARLRAWSEALQLLETGRSALEDKRVRKQVFGANSVDELQSQLGRRLTDVLQRALPLAQTVPPMTPAHWATGMHQLLSATENAALVSADWPQRAATCLAQGLWPDSAVRHAGRGGSGLTWLVVGGIVVLLGIVGIGGLWALLRTGDEVSVTQRGTTSPSASKTSSSVSPPAGSRGSAKSASSGSSASSPGKSASSSPSPDKSPPVKGAAEDTSSVPPQDLRFKDGNKSSLDGSTSPSAPAGSPAPRSEPGNRPPGGSFHVALAPEASPPQSPFVRRAGPMAGVVVPGETALDWVVWSNPTGLKIQQDYFVLHGFREAMSRWSVPNPAAGRPAWTFTLRAAAAGVQVVEVEMPVEGKSVLASFRLEDDTHRLHLQMRVSPFTSPTQFELQRQLTFCVVELRDQFQAPVFVSLQPPLQGVEVPLEQNAVADGNLRHKFEASDLVPRPAAESLQNLHLSRGIVYLRGGTRYNIGLAAWPGATPATEWELQPAAGASPLPGIVLKLKSTGGQMTLSPEAAVGGVIMPADPRSAWQEEWQALSAALTAYRSGPRIRDEEARMTMMADSLRKMCELLKQEFREPPTTPPLKKSSRGKPPAMRLNVEWQAYSKWENDIVIAANARSAWLQTQLNRAAPFARPGLPGAGIPLEVVRQQFDHALVELYREVPHADGVARIRVPVMLVPGLLP